MTHQGLCSVVVCFILALSVYVFFWTVGHHA